MSDLCAPVYVVMDADEEMTFWCFVQFMERMVGWFYTRLKPGTNAGRSGTRKRTSCEIKVGWRDNFQHCNSWLRLWTRSFSDILVTPSSRHSLVYGSCMLPQIKPTASTSFSASGILLIPHPNLLLLNPNQRWVLIAFKREFPFDEVLRLWEVLWTDYYSTQFVLFVALAVLESHRDMILRYLVEVRDPPICSLVQALILGFPPSSTRSLRWAWLKPQKANRRLT